MVLLLRLLLRLPAAVAAAAAFVITSFGCPVAAGEKVAASAAAAVAAAAVAAAAVAAAASAVSPEGFHEPPEVKHIFLLGPRV